MRELTATSKDEGHAEAEARTILGFWTYLLSDAILFALLFACYAVLYRSTFGGPSARELIDLPYALAETLIFLTSSLTCGIAMVYTEKRRAGAVLLWLGVTLLLGVALLAMQWTDFASLLDRGISWKRSGFLSAYFTLIGTHAVHIAVGALWIIVMLFQVASRGLSYFVLRRLGCLRLFWLFLNAIWVTIFTLVYLVGEMIS